MEDTHNAPVSSESYFFRDKGQFALLKNILLPELLEHKKVERSLRIWSAGCSTGEEPYSIAMLLKDHLPQNWEVRLLATDINEESLRKAREARYTDWSFRMVEPGVQQRFFKRHKDRWVLDPDIRNMVTFQVSNILQDPFPSSLSGIEKMDMIWCRNVFIYFPKDSISLAIKKFSDTLTEGGYLITGHGELHAQDLASLDVRMFPDSIIYRKRSAPDSWRKNIEATGLLPQPILKLPTPPPAFLPEKAVPVKSFAPVVYTPTPKFELQSAAPPKSQTSGNEAAKDEKAEIERHLSLGAYDLVIQKIQKSIHLSPDTFEAQCLLAEAYANLGLYDRAIQNCRKAIAGDPLSPKPYFLLAQVTETQGDSQEAKNLLKKAIYLAPNFVAAYLELASLYVKEGENERARKMRTTAVKILEGLPPQASMEPYKGITAGEILQALKKDLGGKVK